MIRSTEIQVSDIVLQNMDRKQVKYSCKRCGKQSDVKTDLCQPKKQ